MYKYEGLTIDLSTIVLKEKYSNAQARQEHLTICLLISYTVARKHIKWLGSILKGGMYTRRNTDDSKVWGWSSFVTRDRP